jgi:enoyl-CoA hydratase/carnithine racemase
VLLGPGAAHRIVLSGELFLASAAQSLGLVHEVISDEGFREAVDARIAQWRKAAPQALAAAKRLLDRATQATLRKELTQESRAFASCFGTEAAEGLAAFLENRPAAWCGQM